MTSMPDQTANKRDARQYSVSAERNREPILEVLRQVFPPAARVLEIGSGTGEHAMHCAPALKVQTWQPSDPEPEARASIASWRDHVGLSEVKEPIDLDVRRDVWPLPAEAVFDVILSINMVHIAPWTASEGLFAGAGRHLAEGGMLILYGPFMRGGKHHAPSNARFDAALRARDPEWGVRDLDALEVLGAANGLHLASVHDMPANNHIAVFRSQLTDLV